MSDFKDYCLEKYSHHTALERISYADHYGHLLTNRDFSSLMAMPETKRLHVLSSLSALAKFQGQYSVFQELIKEYGIKWVTNRDSMIIGRISRSKNPDDVIEWIMQVRKKIPEHDLFMEFLTLSGMRLIEAVNSYNMIIDADGHLDEYYNPKTNALENYKFKDFIRKTKKSYIVFMLPDVITKITRARPISIFNILKITQLRGLRCRYSDVRELHATLLTTILTPSEIDFIQGRIGSSVFMTNYFNPALITDLQTRALSGLANIRSRISIIA